MMTILRNISCLSVVSLMVACAPSGYYDSNGEYRSYGKSDSYRYEHPMSGTPTRAIYHEDDVIYSRAGYYDRNGYYIAMDSGPGVPREFFPPRGMCRVWFIDRLPNEQPRVESCAGIRSRVPVGAYVIYGG